MASVIERRGQPAALTVADGVRRYAQLPDWLQAITQPERVANAMQQTIPEFASGALALESCKVKRVRFKKDAWTAMYQLTVAPRDGDPSRVVAVRGRLAPNRSGAPAPMAASVALGDADWRAYLPDLRLHLEAQPPDAALPALPYLTDPEAARTLLEQSIRGAPGYADFELAACRPRIMRYKPGSRCTILYALTYPPALADRGWPPIVIAKTYDGDNGRNAYAGMQALWESPLARSGVVTIAEPLAFLPELNVLVQGPIREEQTLKELIRSALRTDTPAALDELQAYMRKTAVGLAALHGSEVHLGDVRTWDDELAEVRAAEGGLVQAVPALAGALTPLLDRLDALHREHPADPPVPTHGTFRPAQVLLNAGAIGFIDFDGFCQAEPALDLALFLGKIRDIGLSSGKTDDDDESEPALDHDTLLSRLAQTETICAAFLAAYEAQASVSRQRIALWEALDLLTLVQHCWTKVKPARINTVMLLLEQHLRRMGVW